MRSKIWPRYPVIYEINTWAWLADLTAKYGAFIELDSVPPAEWDAIGELGFDAVWLMGVWERSPAGTAIASRNAGLMDEFRRALPDFHPLDNVGSAYCIRRYVVDELLGGQNGLAAAREELARRGIRLILDFVPNHVAPDHEWTATHPEYFIQAGLDDLRDDPESFMRVKERVFARGRDPYFPAWRDVLQLNGFHPGLRQAMRDTLTCIARQCDGVRCDMAMLLENPIFERTWGNRAGDRPVKEYWAEIIAAVKRAHPTFLFMAEAYWDREWELLQQGFDFCYDKRLYDRLEHDSAESIRLHLCADLEYQERLVRFVENHDEARAASAFSPKKARAVAVAMATLPGARLFHEGQLEGRRVRLPVFLGRRPAERPDRELRAFYRKLLQAIDAPEFHDGRWRLCERTGWPGNSTFQNLLAWSWEKDNRRCLVVVNLGDTKAQGRIHVPWSDTQGEMWRLCDDLSGATYERDGDELDNTGLYVDLEAWDFHLLRCSRSRQVLVPSAA